MKINDLNMIVGNRSIPVASADIDFSTVVRSRSLELLIRSEDVDELSQAWQEIAHSSQPRPGKRPVADLVPWIHSGGADRSLIQCEGANVSHSNVTYLATNYMDVHYFEIGANELSKNHVLYADVQYANVAYKDVSYFTSKGMLVCKEDTADEGESITLSGESDQSKRIVVSMRGVVGLEISLKSPEIELASVIFNFTDDLPAHDLAWIID